MEIKEIDRSILEKIYTSRPPGSRKYDYGLLVVIGGSDFYSGSPALSAFAGFRSGVDMVRIIAPKRAADIIASFSPILAAYPLEGKTLNREHLPTLRSMIESAAIVSRGNAAVLLGGGLGRSDEARDVILDLLPEISVPIIIDADAIYAVKEKKKILAEKDCIITPHYYEFLSLTGKEIYELSFEEKAAAVLDEAARINAIILLKGEADIISDGKEVYANRIGSPYLTVGGCGDTLAGIAGSLAARKASLIDAAKGAAYINGAAGFEAAKKKGESTTAMDLIDEIPGIIKN